MFKKLREKMQIKKMNALAKGGFKLDLDYFVATNQTRLVLTKPVESNVYFTFTLTYNDAMQPILQPRMWARTSSTSYRSKDLIPAEVVGEAQAEENYNALCELSGVVNINSYVNKIRSDENYYSALWFDTVH